MSDDLNMAWYCARTKPKHEHIAAGNVRSQLGLEVFNPRLRIERVTRRGLVKRAEPLFPCYLFVKTTGEAMNELRYVSGISSLVHFGQQVPTVPHLVVEELKQCFQEDQFLSVEDSIMPGAEVSVADGAFQGFQAIVLRVIPARQRVQILLDLLGRQTLVEVDRQSVILENRNWVDLMPDLAVV
ncbi:MAG: transcription termination/antitermination NusG family protein [Verrucomicrobiota bacterium]